MPIPFNGQLKNINLTEQDVDDIMEYDKLLFSYRHEFRQKMREMYLEDVRKCYQPWLEQQDWYNACCKDCEYRETTYQEGRFWCSILYEIRKPTTNCGKVKEYLKNKSNK